MKAFLLSTNSPFRTLHKRHPSNVLVEDRLVGVARPLDIGCIFTALKKIFLAFLTIFSIIHLPDIMTHSTLSRRRVSRIRDMRDLYSETSVMNS